MVVTGKEKEGETRARCLCSFGYRKIVGGKTVYKQFKLGRYSLLFV